MSLTESTRRSDVLLFQEGEELNFIFDNVTLVSGTAASKVGQVLGLITASGKYTQVAPAAVDGSQTAAAVLMADCDASGGDKVALAVVRGPAIFKDAGLLWTSGMTTGQKTTAKAQLGAASMPVRQALGS